MHILGFDEVWQLPPLSLFLPPPFSLSLPISLFHLSLSLNPLLCLSPPLSLSPSLAGEPEPGWASLQTNTQLSELLRGASQDKGPGSHHYGCRRNCCSFAAFYFHSCLLYISLHISVGIGCFVACGWVIGAVTWMCSVLMHMYATVYNCVCATCLCARFIWFKGVRPECPVTRGERGNV